MDTRQSNHIHGTPHRDVIVAKGGNDVIVGDGGRDTICGGPGNDRIDGAVANDRLVGGPGDDHIRGHRGRDLIVGDIDSPFGSATGNTGNDYIDAGLGGISPSVITMADRLRSEAVTTASWASRVPID